MKVPTMPYVWELWPVFKRWWFNRPLIRPATTPLDQLQNLSRNLWGDDRLADLARKHRLHKPTRTPPERQEGSSR